MSRMYRDREQRDFARQLRNGPTEAIETVTSRTQMTVLHQREQAVRTRYLDCR